MAFQSWRHARPRISSPVNQSHNKRWNRRIGNPVFEDGDSKTRGHADARASVDSSIGGHGERRAPRAPAAGNCGDSGHGIRACGPGSLSDQGALPLANPLSAVPKPSRFLTEASTKASRAAPKTRYGTFDELLGITEKPLHPIAKAVGEAVFEVDPNANEVVRLGDRAAAYGLGPKEDDRRLRLHPTRQTVD